MMNSEKHENEKELHEHSPLGAVLTIAVIILAIAICILAVMYYQLSVSYEKKSRMVESLSGQLAETFSKIDMYDKDISELTEKNRILSETLNSKTESYSEMESAETGERIPTGYPLKGTGVIVNDEESTLVQTRFMCDEGVRLVATAEGTVTKVSGDEEDGYVIIIDHENGYKTEYYCRGTILIAEGDRVGRGAVILSVSESGTEMIYKVTLENEYIDPVSVMEING